MNPISPYTSVSEVPAAPRERDTMASTKMLLLLLSMALLALSSARDVNDGTEVEDLREELEVPQDEEEESQLLDTESPEEHSEGLRDKSQGEEHGGQHGNKGKDGEKDHGQPRERHSQKDQESSYRRARRDVLSVQDGQDGQSGQDGQDGQRGRDAQGGPRSRGRRGEPRGQGVHRSQRGRDGRDGQRGDQ
nr:PREDICTED: U1 small nuclear ribonucleoprotein 70 kDa-like isoform X1 [Rhinolophus sinicus]XP_019600299.1 PREDICTED: U1 small nuclear ribonucleoprotein 70 kDa-like isoform X1 [Rhinolophus sinicus]